MYVLKETQNCYQFFWFYDSQIGKKCPKKTLFAKKHLQVGGIEEDNLQFRTLFSYNFPIIFRIFLNSFENSLKVHKNEKFFGSDFEICTFS
jgi:hypothetical protein